MIDFILWYLLVSLVGLIAFPLLFNLLPGLPGRGYGFSRAAGLLIWGFLYWLFGSLNIAGNDAGGALLAFGGLLAAGVWSWRRGIGIPLSNLVRENRRHILVVELLFFGAFAGWAVVRAANPDIFGTEKPMELAFIDAIVKSPGFPPRDPWLSGYAISYYYFGYLITAGLARLTAVPGSVAFNLAISLIYGLSAIGAYTLVFDLLSARRPKSSGVTDPDEGLIKRSGQPFAFLAPVFVLIISNVVGLLTVLHARGLFWLRSADGGLVSSFWKWLDLQELSQAPTEPLSWLPHNFGTGAWWWWRASRVIQDYDINGSWKEVIDEFPAFSFILGDLHPHVLAIPFVLLAIALALNLYLGGASGEFHLLSFKIRLNLPSFLFAALVLGGLAFINIWDFPSFLILFSASYALVRVNQSGWSRGRLWDFLGLLVVLGLSGYLIYLPFHLSFSSQAGGILPNIIYPTRGVHLWIMFGLFFLPLFAYLVYCYQQAGSWKRLGWGLFLASGMLLALWLVSLLLAAGILALPALDSIGLGGVQGYSLNQLSSMFLGSLGANTSQGLFATALARRLASPGGWITLLILLAFVLGLFRPGRREEGGAEGERDKPDVTHFVLLLILLGTLIVIAPEFVYLRDQFGWRINTVFKLYYQAWMVWAIAVTFGVAVMFTSNSRAWKIVSGVGLLLILSTGLIYSMMGIWDRTQGFQPSDGYRLDGSALSPYISPEDRLAVQWLDSAPDGIIAEAVGGSYSEYGRISANSGLPTVLGWPGHESQWRGGATEMGSRESDIQTLYSSRDWVDTSRILEMYGIRYVYLGTLERSLYAVDESKFQRNLSLVYDMDGVRIYEVP